MQVDPLSSPSSLHPPCQKHIFPFETLLPRNGRSTRTSRARRFAYRFSVDDQQVLRRVVLTRVDETPQSIKYFQTWPSCERFDLLIACIRRAQVSHSYERDVSIVVVHFCFHTFNLLYAQKNVLTRVVRTLAFFPQRFAQFYLFTAQLVDSPFLHAARLFRRPSLFKRIETSILRALVRENCRRRGSSPLNSNAATSLCRTHVVMIQI